MKQYTSILTKIVEGKNGLCVYFSTDGGNKYWLIAGEPFKRKTGNTLFITSDTQVGTLIGRVKAWSKINYYDLGDNK